MEPSLSAREFLQRFHLPQLVRLAPQVVPSTNNTWMPETSNTTCSSSSNGGDNDAQSTGGGDASLRSSTSISSSFVALASAVKQPVDGGDDDEDEWTYLRAAGNSTQQQLLQRQRQRQPDEQFRSLVGLDEQQQQQRLVSSTSAHHFHSIPLNTAVSTNAGEQLRRPTSELPPVVGISPERQAPPDAGTAYAPLGDGIRLTPLSKRLSSSKLQLEQPFLLYKAFKKYDVCCYMIDTKNELTDKSGDPIYLPQNYPGWFSMASNQFNATTYESASKAINNNNIPPSPPLSTIDEVCRSSAQVFLTRDELIGFQLPSKLSHLTKLKNNQLLALPLAINLEKISYENGCVESSKSQNHSSSANSSGEIKQVVIQCGQTLKIRGVYEDVLPLFEGKHQQQQSSEFKQYRSKQKQQSSYAANTQSNQSYVEQSLPPHSIVGRQMAQRTPLAYQQQQQQQLYSVQQQNGYLEGHSRAKSAIKRATTQLGQHHQQVPSSFIYAPHNQLQQKRHSVGSSAFKQHSKSAAQSAATCYSPAVAAGGQRYARCVLLSQNSVDKLTNCSSSLVNSDLSMSNNNSNNLNSSATTASTNNATTQEEEDEVEVLIPIEQRGRFYLCATNQSIVNELYCHGCHSAGSAGLLNPSAASTASTPLVFRLSQIITLLSLSQRLVAANRRVINQQHHLHHNHQVIAGANQPLIRLPLNVQLITGPRPANFSPSMLGSIGANLESYFNCEAHIGGHSIGCSFNRNFVSSRHRQSNSLVQVKASGGARASEVACACALRIISDTHSSSQSYGIFSGQLRIERIAKRDVLLACTIKRDPLLHLSVPVSRAETVIAGERNQQQQQQRIGGTITNNTFWSTAQQSDNELSSLLANEQTKRIPLQSSAKLLALREDNINHRSSFEIPLLLNGNNNNNNRKLRTSGGDTTNHSHLFAAAAKSSFSKLRVCRSLISLNGRRKRQRPNIPNSMLTATNQLELSLDGAQSNCDSTSLLLLQQQQQYHNNNNANSMVGNASTTTNISDNIAMIEFDCDNSQLRFVRTFLESSIPTSTIPDLVLNRMEFCQRNSSDWERQLKLSYNSLSGDFDLLRRQLSLAANQQQQQIRDQQQQRQCNRATFSSVATPIDSTASSRSSSGVSSAGEQRLSQKVVSLDASGSSSLGSSNLSGGGGGECNNNRRFHTSISAANSLASGICTANSVTTTAVAQQPNRLLRLVQRILPLRRQQQQQRLNAQVVVDDLSSRLSRNLLLNEQRDTKHTTTTTNGPPNTLMNAQKVHRRLMIGSSLRQKQQQQPIVSINGEEDTNSQLNNSSSASTASSGSHLYESLERLNVGLRSKSSRRLAAMATSHHQLDDGQVKLANKRQVISDAAPRSLPVNQRIPCIGGRRLGLGKSIEFLCGVGGRRATLLGLKGQSRRRRSDNINHSEGFGTESDVEDYYDEDGAGSYDYDNDDDDDDWWHSSTQECALVSQSSRTCATPEPGSAQVFGAKVATSAGAAAAAAAQQRRMRGEQQRSRRVKAAAAAADANYLMEPVSIEACNDEFVASAFDSDTADEQQEESYLSGGGGGDTCEDGSVVDTRQVSCRSERAHIEHQVCGGNDSVGADEGDREDSNSYEDEDEDDDGDTDAEHIYVNLQSRSSFHLAQRQQVSRMERKLQRIRARRQQQQQERPLSSGHWTGSSSSSSAKAKQLQDKSQQQQQQRRKRVSQQISSEQSARPQQQQQQQQLAPSRSSLADESVNSSASLCSSSAASNELNEMPPGGVQVISSGGNQKRVVAAAADGAVQQLISAAANNSLRSSTCSTSTSASDDDDWTTTDSASAQKQQRQQVLIGTRAFLVGQVTKGAQKSNVRQRALRANSLEAWPLATLDRPTC